MEAKKSEFFIEKMKEKYYTCIVNLRHYLHQNPELGFEEFKTSAKICEILDKYGIQYQKNIAKTGIIAQISGNKKSINPKCVLLRADMDALPIQELCEVPYKSLTPNIMHACGHDGHCASLVGAILMLNELKDKFSGVIKFVFQPAEELSGGALPMIELGVLENPKVDACFSGHLWGYFLENEMHVKQGAIFAAPDEFIITCKGKGGHGSRADLCINPILVASYAVTALQSLVSSRLSPFDNVTLSFGSISGGCVFNVIPDEVTIKGTVRTLDEKVRENIPHLMEQILQGVGLTHGATCELKYIKRFPVLVNDEKMTKIAKKAFSKICKVYELNQPILGGEDFAYFAKKVPSCFVLVGISKSLQQQAMHHSPHFQWEDENMKNLSLGLSNCAIEFLNS